MKKLLGNIYLGLREIYNRFIGTPYMIRQTIKKGDINIPLVIDADCVKIDNYSRLQPDVKIISAGIPVVIKKFTALSSGCLVIPGAHVPTVGIPQYLSTLHINDKGKGIIINEDCWIGAEAALLSRCEIGRGCVVATRTVVTKPIPPYAVVAGAPAKVIATRFSLDEIIQHERILYPATERLDVEYLKNLFETTYKGLKSIGTSEISPEDLDLLNETKIKLGIPIFS